MRKYEVSGFCMRQVDPGFIGTKLTCNDIDDIMNFINANPDAHRPGYMPGVIVWDLPLIPSEPSMHFKPKPCFDNIRCPVAEITEENQHLLVTEYKARRDGEIPILTRYFRSANVYGGGLGIERVKPLSVEAVVYTRAQLEAEGDDECVGEAGDLVVVLANRYEGESLMSPDTMIRNHMGPDFGGSGKALDREAYMKSVEFWSKHALVE